MAVMLYDGYMNSFEIGCIFIQKMFIVLITLSYGILRR